jgi:hypothetical protein
MTITNIELAIRDYTNWDGTREIPGYINRQVIDGPNIYDYVISDSVAVPKTVIFNVNPTPYTGPNIISENNTDVNKNKRIKFSEKVVETTTHTTTKGFKIGGGIKSTTKGTLKLKFPVGELGFEQTLELLPLTGEYNSSSTTGNTCANEKLWEITDNITVPPHSRVTSTLIIMKTEVRVPMELTTNLRGTNSSGEGSFPTSNGLFSYTTSARGTVGGIFVSYYVRPASALYNTSWPDKPATFNSIGSNESLNLLGSGYSDVVPSLYVTIRQDQTPLSGYPGETKTWYSDKVILRDGRIVTLPSNADVNMSQTAKIPYCDRS